MTPEQLDTLLDIANRGAFLAPSDPSAGYDARAAAASELAAMRQPITAEALRADGWKWDPQDREYTLTIPQKWTFFYNVEYSVLQVHCWDTESSVTVRTMSNMHDLGELVRLLGGAAQQGANMGTLSHCEGVFGGELECIVVGSPAQIIPGLRAKRAVMWAADGGALTVHIADDGTYHCRHDRRMRRLDYVSMKTKKAVREWIDRRKIIVFGETA